MVQGVKTPEGVIYEASPGHCANRHKQLRLLRDAKTLTLGKLKMVSLCRLRQGTPSTLPSMNQTI